MTVRIALVLVALAVGLGGAACGGDEDTGGTPTEQTTTLDTTTTDETTTDETTTEDDTTTDDGATTEAGRAIFSDNCAGCHALEDASAAGAVGPSLDESTLGVDDVDRQVREGGGDMPAFADTLSDDEIETVSAYVVAVRRG